MEHLHFSAVVPPADFQDLNIHQYLPRYRVVAETTASIPQVSFTWKTNLRPHIRLMSQSQQAPAAMEFSTPPSFKDTQADPGATLAWLTENISTIYQTARTPSPSPDKPPALSRSAYLGLYTTAHNYVEITKHAYKANPSDREPLNGQDLYQSLEKIIRSHCAEISARLFTTASDTDDNGAASHAMIQEYLAQCQMLTQDLAALVAHLLRHLERVWIQREVDEKRRGVYFIPDLHKVIWKEVIVLQVGANSTTAAAATVRSELDKALRTLMQGQGEDGVERDRKALAERCLETLRPMGVELNMSV